MIRNLALLMGVLLLTACNTGSDSGVHNNNQNNGDDDVTDSDGSIFIPDEDTDSVSELNNLCRQVHYSPVSNNTSGADPLLDQQWYLRNNGAIGSIKQDINLTDDIWSRYTGQGVTVAVVDTAIDYSHPDLQANLDLRASCHFTDSSEDGGHATSVSGLIAAVKDNALGMTGAAPNSLIRGFNTLNGDNSSAQWLASLSATSDENRDIDVFNLSLGYEVLTELAPLDDSLLAITEDSVTSGRNGLGALYFKAAGNHYEDSDANYCMDPEYYSFELPCQNANMDPDNNNPYFMVVGALNADGTRATYSSSGSSVLFSAPGGDDGAGIITTNDIYIPTDISDMAGYSGYTNAFSGTSAATPLVSGVAALLLEANPSLGWRDIRDILIRTANPVNTDQAAETLTMASEVLDEDAIIDLEKAWISNAAGLNYHNDYGFGRINASEALRMATTYNVNLPAQRHITVPGNPQQRIISDSAPGFVDSAYISSGSLTTVESVQLNLELSHPFPSDLVIKVTSPRGTESILMTPRNGLIRKVLNADINLLSQTFYGEPLQGSWTLEIIDTHADSYENGYLHDWSLTLYGH